MDVARLSVITVVLDQLGFHALRSYDQDILGSIDFSDVLMEGMLSFLANALVIRGAMKAAGRS